MSVGPVLCATITRPSLRPPQGVEKQRDKKKNGGDSDKGELKNQISIPLWPHTHIWTGPILSRLGPAQGFSNTCAKLSLRLPLKGPLCVHFSPAAPSVQPSQPPIRLIGCQGRRCRAQAVSSLIPRHRTA